MLTGEKVIPNGFYKFSKYISKKLKAKSSGNFQKGFENLTEEYFKYVNFLDFKDYEEFSLDKYGFENLKLIYTPGHSRIRFLLSTMTITCSVEIWFKIYALNIL